MRRLVAQVRRHSERSPWLVDLPVAVFLFAFLGLEHSVANTILFTVVGLEDGLDLGAAGANVGIALLGNFLGGGVLIGLYYAYVNDDARYHPQAG